jgi:hypothetical protein
VESPQDNETMPLKDGFNFTPLFKGQRVRMRAQAMDSTGRAFISGALRIRQGGMRGVVRDSDTNLVYMVISKACEIDGCWCDAEIHSAGLSKPLPPEPKPSRNRNLVAK